MESPIASVSIVGHTTASTPYPPHILYIVKVYREDNTAYDVLRRYSQFAALRDSLGSVFPFPPKRAMASSVLPFAWVDDDLISERKTGLQMYLNNALHDLQLRYHPALLAFLAPEKTGEEHKLMREEHLIKAEQTETERSYIAASYYPSWASGTLPPKSIDFNKFDVIFFAFVTPNGVAGIDWDSGSQNVLKSLVSSARNSGSGTKIVLSVGGWSGSHWFSQAMSTQSNREKLVNTLSETVNSYGLDGIDIDWEYPNSSGAGNPHSSADAANLLKFFEALRNALGTDKIISAAVTQLPWVGPTGSPLTDVSEYAKYMTFVNIMNYDVFDSSDHPGPNAPLGDLCKTSTQPHANAQAALAQWTKAGMPASKLLLGLALYGYVSKSSDKKLTGSLVSTNIRESPFAMGMHRRNNLQGEITALAAPKVGDLSSMWGQQIPFAQLVSMGALVKNKDGNYVGHNGYITGWDNCSDTPYIYNSERTTVVSYDDTYSIADKTRFAKTSGMAGCFTWSMDQDDGVTLQDVILANL